MKLKSKSETSLLKILLVYGVKFNFRRKFSAPPPLAPALSDPALFLSKHLFRRLIERHTWKKADKAQNCCLSVYARPVHMAIK